MTYKKLLSGIFLLCVASLQAQDNSWSFGLAFSPDLCYRVLQADDGIGESLKKDRDNRENMKLGYTVGFMVRKNLGNLGFMESGLLYANKGFGSTMPVIFGDQIDPVNGVNGTSTASILYHFKYLGLPIKINYTMARLRRMDLYFSTGAGLEYLVEQKTVSHFFRDPQPDESYTSYSTNDWNRMNVSPMLGMGIDIRLRERINLLVEPQMRYGMLPVNEGIVRTRLWAFGVNGVLYCRL